MKSVAEVANQINKVSDPSGNTAAPVVPSTNQGGVTIGSYTNTNQSAGGSGVQIGSYDSWTITRNGTQPGTTQNGITIGSYDSWTITRNGTPPVTGGSGVQIGSNFSTQIRNNNGTYQIQDSGTWKNFNDPTLSDTAKSIVQSFLHPRA